METSVVEQTQEERNHWFQTLTRAEQRVQIARDVLQKLRDEVIYPVTCSYLNARLKNPIQAGALQDALKELDTCDVCAKGALFLARVAGYNEVDMPSLYGSTQLTLCNEDMYYALKDIFTEIQLSLIENAFECAELNFHPLESNALSNAAAHMYSAKLPAKNRLRDIMENIIRNQGEFRVEDGYQP